MRTLVVVLGAAAMAAGWSLGGRSAPAPAVVAHPLDTKLAAIASGMNQITPKTMANGATLRSVRADGHTLALHVDGVLDWRPGLNDGEMTRMMGGTLCTRVDIREMIGEGAHLRFDLTTPGGATLPPLVLNRCA